MQSTCIITVTVQECSAEGDEAGRLVALLWGLYPYAQSQYLSMAAQTLDKSSINIAIFPI